VWFGRYARGQMDRQTHTQTDTQKCSLQYFAIAPEGEITNEYWNICQYNKISTIHSGSLATSINSSLFSVHNLCIPQTHKNSLLTLWVILITNKRHKMAMTTTASKSGRHNNNHEIKTHTNHTKSIKQLQKLINS